MKFWGQLWPDAQSGGGGGGSGSVTEINSISERWDPVVAILEITSGELFIMAKQGQLKFTIYDPVVGFAEFYGERSSVEVDGTTYTVTILPNGGWQREDIQLQFVVGSEIS